MGAKLCLLQRLTSPTSPCSIIIIISSIARSTSDTTAPACEAVESLQHIDLSLLKCIPPPKFITMFFHSLLSRTPPGEKPYLT